MEAKIVKKAVLFKTYDQSQQLSLPVNIETLIPACHLVRIVNSAVEEVSMEDLSSYYLGSGCPPYHPKMLIKVWLYGYCEGIYTSRKISKALRENINFIYLSGNQNPCFKTLSSFRSGRMQDMVDTIFRQLLVMLVDMGYIDLNTFFVDGSKFEADANRHQVCWRKNTERYKSTVLERINAILERIKALQSQEDSHYGSKDLAELGTGESLTIVLNSEQLQEHLSSLSSIVSSQSKQDTHAKEYSSLEKKLKEDAEKLAKYEQQEVVLAGRNSYSKTDQEATFMQMKRKECLPAYNVQHSTQNQYIVNYTISQNPSDNPTLIEHLDKYQQRLEGIRSPQTQAGILSGMSCGADAGYGSEENFAYSQSLGIEAYIKYPMWYQEHSGELAKKKFRVENWHFDSQKDTFTCPNGRLLVFKEKQIKTTKTGYERDVKIYECQSCVGCPFVEECKKSKEDHQPRTVQISPKMEQYKQQAKQMLDSPKGVLMRKQRSTEVETGFGDVKFNMNFDRFHLRSKNKVYVEYGLVAMAHNLRKVFCKESGIWEKQYAQRAKKAAKKKSKSHFYYFFTHQTLHKELYPENY